MWSLAQQLIARILITGSFTCYGFYKGNQVSSAKINMRYIAKKQFIQIEQSVLMRIVCSKFACVSSNRIRLN